MKEVELRIQDIRRKKAIARSVVEIDELFQLWLRWNHDCGKSLNTPHGFFDFSDVEITENIKYLLAQQAKGNKK